MSLTEKWTNKLFNGKGREGESASMMDHVDVPARPPPLPPGPIRIPSIDDDMNPYEDNRFDHDPFYISSPEPMSPPPGLMAVSPTSPDVPNFNAPPAPAPAAATAEAIKLPLSRALTRGAEIKYEPPIFEPENRYCDVDAPELAPPEDEDLTPAPAPTGKAPVEGTSEIEIDEEDIPDQPPLIIITGAASGLGLALFQHFAARPLASPTHHKYDVLGIDRTAWRLPGKGFQWQTTIGVSGKFVQVDVTGSLKRLDTFASNFLYTTLPADDPARDGDIPVMRRYPRPVSLLIHCMRGTSSTPASAETLDAVDAPVLRAAFDGAVVGVLQLMQTVIPHLQLHAESVRARAEEVAAAFGGGMEWLDQLRVQGSRASLQVSRPLPPREPPARAVVLGGGMGKFEGAGGGYAARASKAALGAVMGGMSVDVPEVCFAGVEVARAEMGLVNGNGSEKGSFDHAQTLEELLPLMEKLGDGALASGCFVDKFGDPVKW